MRSRRLNLFAISMLVSSEIVVYSGYRNWLARGVSFLVKNNWMPAWTLSMSMMVAVGRG